MLPRHGAGTYQGNKLTRDSSGNACPQSSQVTEPLWTDSGLQSRTGVSELLSAITSWSCCRCKQHSLGTELLAGHGGVGHVSDRLDGNDHGVQFSLALLRQQRLVQHHSDEQVLNARHWTLEATRDALHACNHAQRTKIQHHNILDFIPHRMKK